MHAPPQEVEVVEEGEGEEEEEEMVGVEWDVVVDSGSETGWCLAPWH